jgi:hypothetical protein
MLTGRSNLKRKRVDDNTVNERDFKRRKLNEAKNNNENE